MEPGADEVGDPAILEGRYGRAASVYHLDPGDPGDFRELAELLLPPRVSRRAREPLRRVLDVARRGGCRAVVVEHRYIDPDYRSDYSAFWSRRFEDRRSVAQRVHFFASTIGVEDLPRLPADHRYLGYCVVRPTLLGPVGRTVLAPPPELQGATLTTVRDRPSLFGTPLDVEGVPFCQQDGEFLVCAHTAAWLCHYVAHMRGVIGRRLTAEIASLPSIEGSKHRPLPASGLTGEQLQAVFSALGTPAIFYDVDDLPDPPTPLPKPRLRRRADHEEDLKRERILRVVCKYLNSGFPLVVLTEGSDDHAFTLVGWQQAGDGVRLIACDDQVGPYEIIEDPLAEAQDHREKWRSLMIPLPEKVFFTGEAAEVRARNLVRLILANMSVQGVGQPEELNLLAEGLEHLKGPISLRARLLEGREFKRLVVDQGRGPDVERILRLAHLPHWVWVVEMQDREAREAGEPSVLAEVVFDSTAHDDVPLPRLLSTMSISSDLTEQRAGAAPDICLASGPDARWHSLVTNP